jgi:hypothetical protein
MYSAINKIKVEKVLNKSDFYNIIQTIEEKQYVTDGCCIWIFHNDLFSDNDKYYFKGKEVTNEKQKKDISEMVKIYIENMDSAYYDYQRVNLTQKCKQISETGTTKKAIYLQTQENYHAIVDEKYFNTFSKRCNFFISAIYKQPIIIGDSDNLLIGFIMPLTENNGYTIEK